MPSGTARTAASFQTANVSLAMSTQERGDMAVVTCPGKRRGSGSHLQCAGMRERGE